MLPLVLFFIEKESKFVKYESIQAAGVGIAQAAIAIILKIIYWIIQPSYSLRYISRGFGAYMLVSGLDYIIHAAFSLIVVYVLVKAYGYKQVELPIIEPIAKKMSQK